MDNQRQLYRELTLAAQETRLMLELLDAAAASGDVRSVVRVVQDNLLTVFAAQVWSGVRLVLRDARDPQRLYEYRAVGGGISRYWDNVRRGAMLAAADLGIELTFVLGDGGDDLTGQRQQIIAALHDRVDGIGVAPIAAAALEPIFADARAAAVPLVTFDTPPIADSAALVYIGTDNYAAGRRAGEVLRQLVPPEAEVATAVDSLVARNGVERVRGFRDALAGHTSAIMDPLEDQYDAERGRATAVAVLAAQPNLAGAFGACGANGPNWGRALDATQRAGSVRLICFDIGADSVRLLMDGTASAVIAQREREMGYRTVEILARIVTAGAQHALAGTATDGMIDTPVDVVTLERTPYSTALHEYLQLQSRRPAPDLALKAALTQRSAPLRLTLVGMAERNAPVPGEHMLPLDPQTLVGQVITRGRAQVIDPQTAVGWHDLATLAADGTRTCVATPLLTRGQVLGALCFTSTTPDACTPADLALVERIGAVTASVIDRVQLLTQAERRARELEAAAQRQEAMLATILEISTQVVPIAPGILVVPLTGTIDATRAERMVGALLAKIGARAAHSVLLDITGVSIVDTYVAQVLIQTAQAVRLLGAEVVLVGITPAVAQTIVSLGVDLSSMTTRADLASGFAFALARRGGRISYGR